MSGERSGQRLVGDLWCGDVLAVLSDLLDGGLSAEVERRVRVHLAGCSECSQFGEEFGRVIRALGGRRGSAEGPGPEVEERLSARLAALTGKKGGGQAPPPVS